MAFGRVAVHLTRIRHQLGRPLLIGTRHFKSRGYFASRLALDTDHEFHLRPLFERVLAASNGPVIDVGANLGQTLAKVLAVDPERIYIGFEPQLACCFFIDQFLKDNALSNCRILPVALSDTNGSAIIYSRDPYDEMASLRDQHTCSIEYLHQSSVLVRKGAELLDEMGIEGISLIKVDVEGAELPALIGLRPLLAAQKPALIFEVLPNFEGRDRTMLGEVKRHEASKRADQLFLFLTELGYQVWQIDRNGDERPIHRFELDDPSNFVGSDYVARPVS